MRRYSLLVLAVLLCALACPPASFAQSGRKQKKAEPMPPVQGVNQPELRTVQETVVGVENDKPKEKDKTGVEVVSDLADIGIPLYYSDIARKAFLQEMRKLAQNAQASDGGNNKNRKEASDIAKNSERTYVVWLELQADQFGTSNYGFDLRYTIYEPKTGKQIAFGSGYPQRPNGIPQPPIGMSQVEVYLEWAARDVAQRVVEKVGLRASY